MKLHLAPDLALPPEAVTQTFGVLAMRGAGKSNTAAVMAEEMFTAKLPFVAIDPVGAWWGLRSSGDGAGPGLPIPIFGGRHGDVPLERTAGQLLADLVVDERLSCVLDTSEFSEGDKVRFLLEFANRLYRRNQDPLHLFLEEADDYLPQRPFRQQAECLRAWENIVRRGRARGLGCTLITQRSASLNKSVLTQIETLIVLRTTSPQDRKAIEGWVEYHGQSRELLSSLPGLESGEAWVWSPQWLGILKRVRIRRRRTFDSGATPKDVKGRRPPATIADVDLGTIQRRMAATIERAKQEDPRELRRRIQELERRAKTPGPATTAPAKEKVVEKRIEVAVLKEGQLARFEKVTDRLATAGLMLVELGKDLRESIEKVARGNGHRAAPPPIAQLRNIEISKSRPPVPPHSRPPRRQTPPVEGISALQQRILNALAWLEAIGIEQGDRRQVALLARAKPTGGYYNNSVSSLRTNGFLDYPREGLLALTEAGRAIAMLDQVPQSSEELQAQVFEMVTALQRRMLEALVTAYPDPVDREQLAAAANADPAGGYFNNSVSALRTLGVIDYPSKGFVVALPVLFLEEARR